MACLTYSQLLSAEFICQVFLDVCPTRWQNCNLIYHLNDYDLNGDGSYEEGVVTKDEQSNWWPTKKAQQQDLHQRENIVSATFILLTSQNSQNSKISQRPLKTLKYLKLLKPFKLASQLIKYKDIFTWCIFSSPFIVSRTSQLINGQWLVWV